MNNAEEKIMKRNLFEMPLFEETIPSVRRSESQIYKRNNPIPANNNNQALKTINDTQTPIKKTTQSNSSINFMKIKKQSDLREQSATTRTGSTEISELREIHNLIKNKTKLIDPYKKKNLIKNVDFTKNDLFNDDPNEELEKKMK
jgi:hypothetical protein